MRQFNETLNYGNKISEMMQSFWEILGPSDMMAYLSMMTPRLLELHRTLKTQGSIFLHCDPTASHYLKIVLDNVFGTMCFRNEIVWKRTTSSSSKSVARRLGSNHDIIFWYTKSDLFQFYNIYLPYPEKEIKKRFKRCDERGYFKDAELATYSDGKLDQLKKENKLIITPSGRLRYKIYLEEIKGIPLDDVWIDVPPINSMAKERLGYPTQKPLKLLKRILNLSSRENDVILDPFCGCGTAIEAAESLGRNWIGIDVTYAATNLIKYRLNKTFSKVDFGITGEPTTLSEANNLAKTDPYQFQWWALGLVKARPVEEKKGADSGIDGKLPFRDEGPKIAKVKQVIISVKAGKVGVSHLRDLRGVLDREKAEIGVLICMQEPTAAMRKEAATGGFYRSPWWNKEYPRLQILTIKELLEGRDIAKPPSFVDTTFERPAMLHPQRKFSGKKVKNQQELFESADEQ